MNECLEKKFRNQVADYSKEDWADCRSSREKKNGSDEPRYTTLCITIQEAVPQDTWAAKNRHFRRFCGE